jgi:hypothetical protein
MSAGCSFLWDIAHPIFRVYPDVDMKIMLGGDILSPYNEYRTIHLYWCLFAPIVRLRQLDHFKATIDISITILSGAGHCFHTNVTVNEDCKYGEFAAILSVQYIRTERPPWFSQGCSLRIGTVPSPSNGRLYLCPATFNENDYDMLCAIHAGPDSSVSNVLRELIWGDWFSELPITQIFPGGQCYKLLIAPSGGGPSMQAFAGIRYLAKLDENIVQIGNPLYTLKLREIPKILADHCAQLMAQYEAENDTLEWLCAHSGVVIGRVPINWYSLPPLISVEDYHMLQASGRTVTRIASDCCPDWCKW